MVIICFMIYGGLKKIYSKDKDTKKIRVQYLIIYNVILNLFAGLKT